MMLDINMQTSELMTICLEGIRRQSKETKTNSELGSFWNTIAYLVSQGELIEDCGFKIKGVRKFTSSTVKADRMENRRVLYLQKSKVFMLYKMKARMAGDNVIPEESLKYYLEQSRAFLGEKNMRYYVAINGIKQPIPGTENGHIRYQLNTQRSYCFDYDLLSSLYQLNLQSDMSFRRSADGFDSENEDDD